jgi:drug/metabolite transporter (DMT)-like permease
VSEAATSRARLAVCVAAALFSTGGAAIKYAQLTGWQVASFRSGVAALAVLLLLPEARRGWSRATAVVAVGYAATLTLFVLSNKLTTSANAIYLQSTAPLYIVLIAPWLLHERPHRRDLFFMVALAGGLGLFFLGAEPARATAPDPVRGNLLAIASGVAWAFTVTGLRWMGKTEGENPGAAAGAVAMGNLLAFVVGLPFALPVEHVGTGDVVSILYLGVFQIGLAYVCLTRGLRHVTALEASLLLTIEPVLNPVWAWIVHGEVPSAFALSGGALILVATVAHSVAASGGMPRRGPGA